MTQQYLLSNPQSVLRRGQGVKLHDSLIIVHEQMLDDELGPVRQNLANLREGARHEIRVRLIVPRVGT